MTVLILAACPVGLRGYLTRWLLEVAPGVFVGRVSARVRDALWEATVELSHNGRALLIFSAKNEQGLDFRVHQHTWEPTDFDGLTLMSRPLPGSKKWGSRAKRRVIDETAPGQIRYEPNPEAPTPELKPGWSKASQWRRRRRPQG